MDNKFKADKKDEIRWAHENRRKEAIEKEGKTLSKKKKVAKKMQGEYKVRLKMPKWAIEEAKRREAKKQADPIYQHQRAIVERNRKELKKKYEKEGRLRDFERIYGK